MAPVCDGRVGTPCFADVECCQCLQITDAGAEVLAGGIVASTIRQIHIRNNDLTEKGTKVLVDALAKHETKNGYTIDLLGVQHLLDANAGDRPHGRSPVRERSGSPVRRS